MLQVGDVVRHAVTTPSGAAREGVCQDPILPGVPLHILKLVSARQSVAHSVVVDVLEDRSQVLLQRLERVGRATLRSGRVVPAWRVGNDKTHRTVAWDALLDFVPDVKRKQKEGVDFYCFEDLPLVMRL